jgi:hypothetical protein
MQLTLKEKQFVKANETLVLGIIDKRFYDCQWASINGGTVEEREKARLLALEYQTIKEAIGKLDNPTKKTKKDTGI